MSELEDKLNALMNNPQIMQQISAMAQSMGMGSPDPPAQPAPTPNMPGLDPNQLQAIVQAAGQTSMDKDQQALLNALTPYLSTPKIRKLERAMRASKMAGIASLFLNSGGLQMLTGR